MGHPAWPAGRTCNPIISFSLTWHGAKPRTTWRFSSCFARLPQPGIWFLLLLSELGDAWYQHGLFVHDLGSGSVSVRDLMYLELCGQVSVHDLNYWSLILKVVYSYMEAYLGSIILFDCAFTGFSSHRITSMIQFFSSVISMVVPTWPDGPTWGNPFGRVRTNGTLNSHILIW